MNQDKDNSVNAADGREGNGRRTWSAPKLVRLRAHEAEGGANPLTPEGQFATGS
jgi:hypothetical protein